ncbi:MAG: universal stress protein [Myxococcales bacterium]|nr:universal stress protein [Myxococcales bacterium]
MQSSHTPPKKILVANDFSENAVKAIDFAADLAARYGASLTILHVYEVPGFHLPEGFVPEEHEAAKLRKEVERALERDGERARSFGVSDIEVLAVGDRPYNAILKTAEGGHFDLLVMGYHGQSGIRRALIGSVTEKVLRVAPCPVLTVL